MPSLANTLLLPLAAAIVLALVAYAAVLTGRWLLRHEASLRAAGKRVVALPGMHYLRRIHHRMSAGEYLGFYLLGAALVCAAALYVFVRVLLAVLDRNDFTHFDRDAARVLYRTATPWGVKLWGFVSHLGTYPVMGSIGAVFAILLWRRGNRIFLPAWVLALTGATVLNTQLKLMVRRARPFWEEPHAIDNTFSFPSGHSLGSVVGYGLIAYATFLLTRRSAVWLPTTVALGILVLAIGYSRMYLGVHFFSDVVGGYALGSFWLAACLTGISLAHRRER